MNKKVICFALSAMLFALCFSAEAQQAGKIPRIGILANVPAPQIDALEQTLRDAGYVEGQNIITEKRYAEGRLERFPDLAAELVHLKVNVIVSIGPATHPTLPKASKISQLLWAIAVIPWMPESSPAWRGPGATLPE
jgi:putative ABC transport system substrate-binding protein